MDAERADAESLHFEAERNTANIGAYPRMNGLVPLVERAGPNR